MAKAIASGSATRPTVTPAVTSAPSVAHEYCRSATTSFGTAGRRRCRARGLDGGSGGGGSPWYGGHAGGARRRSSLDTNVTRPDYRHRPRAPGPPPVAQAENMPARGGRPVTRFSRARDVPDVPGRPLLAAANPPPLTAVPAASGDLLSVASLISLATLVGSRSCWASTTSSSSPSWRAGCRRTSSRRRGSSVSRWP